VLLPLRPAQSARPLPDPVHVRPGHELALRGEPGVIGHDEERGDELRAIEFERIPGGKPFDISVDWFGALLSEIGQPRQATDSS
jgi:hypothetical protein